VRVVLADDGEERANMWRQNIEEMRDSQVVQKVDLQSLVYGKENDATTIDAVEDSDDSDDDDMFKPVKKAGEAADGEAADVDTCKFGDGLLDADLADWDHEEDQEGIRNRFVTGDWGKSLNQNRLDRGSDDEGEDAAGPQNRAADGDESDEVFGDFEDLETGQSFGPGDAPGADASSEEDESGDAVAKDPQLAAGADPHEADRRKAKAAKLAALDNNEIGMDDKGPGKKDGADEEEEGEEEDAHHHIKGLTATAETQAGLNKAEFGGASDETREGLLRQGNFVILPPNSRLYGESLQEQQMKVTNDSAPSSIRRPRGLPAGDVHPDRGGQRPG
jgi:ribosome biogenesis protein BMS1